MFSHMHHPRNITRLLHLTLTLPANVGFFNDVFPPVVRFVPAHMIEGEDNDDEEY